MPTREMLEGNYLSQNSLAASVTEKHMITNVSSPMAYAI
jgi:hypothetical protein